MQNRTLIECSADEVGYIYEDLKKKGFTDIEIAAIGLALKKSIVKWLEGKND